MNLDINTSRKLPTIVRGAVMRLEGEGLRVYTLSDGRQVLHSQDVLDALFGGMRLCSATTFLVMASFYAIAVSGDRIPVCDLKSFLSVCAIDADERPSGISAAIAMRFAMAGAHAVIAKALRPESQ
jgi:hypothetical protein